MSGCSRSVQRESPAISTSRTHWTTGPQKLPSATTGLRFMTPLLIISHTTASSTSVPVPPRQTT